MTSTLTQAQLPQHVRDWAEIQERMLVPLYEAVYQRMEVGSSTRLLGLGSGAGLALLLAASRGASVTGVEPDASRLALARERLQSPGGWDTRQVEARLVCGTADQAAMLGGPPPNLVTAFDALPAPDALGRLAASLERGTPVVLAGWGPPERCSAAPVLRVAARLAEPLKAVGCWRGGRRDDLEKLAYRAGLKLDGSGRVSCPFGYADMDSAVRGLLSTGLYDGAVRATDQQQVLKELAEALHPYRREDGTVWMPNLFRYVVARA